MMAWRFKHGRRRNYHLSRNVGALGPLKRLLFYEHYQNYSLDRTTMIYAVLIFTQK
jgi:hypothetical protein